MSSMGTATLICLTGFVTGDSVAQWGSFKADHHKTYRADEELRRLRIFRQNLERIEVENSRNQGYTLGVTQFADLTQAEFALLMASERPVSSDQGRLGFLEASDRELPDTLDWVQKGAVTGVKNQLHCGACWAFSAMGAMEGHLQIATGRLQTLAEQQLVDCDTDVVPSYINQGCKGGWPSNAFMYAVTHSICTEDSYTYVAKSQGCRAASCDAYLAAGVVQGFQAVTPDSEQALIEALQLGPVSVELNGNSFALQFYKSGIVSGRCPDATDHGVLVVGYAPDYFKIKNSWGNSWGEGGYVRLARGKGGHGQCGFLTAPSFPVLANSSVVV